MQLFIRDRPSLARRAPLRPPLPLVARRVDVAAGQERKDAPGVGRVVRVCVAVCEFLARGRGGREGGVGVQGEVLGVGAAVEVVGDEGFVGGEGGLF